MRFGTCALTQPGISYLEPMRSFHKSKVFLGTANAEAFAPLDHNQEDTASSKADEGSRDEAIL